MNVSERNISNLYVKHNYTSNLSLVKNVSIIEYDMKDAGYNLLKMNSIFSEDEIIKLDSMNKNDRNIWIGKFIKERPNVSRTLMNSFIEARKLFFEANEIEDHHVISIKKDAIFVMKECYNNKFNEFIEFRPKNKYILYCNIAGKEFYYNPKEDKLDVKGFSDIVKEHHSKFLFNDVKKLLNMTLLSDSRMGLVEELIYLKHEFVSFELPSGYYLDLIFGEYMVELYNGNVMSIPFIDDDVKKNCMINNNLNFILSLMSVLL